MRFRCPIREPCLPRAPALSFKVLQIGFLADLEKRWFRHGLLVCRIIGSFRDKKANNSSDFSVLQGPARLSRPPVGCSLLSAPVTARGHLTLYGYAPNARLLPEL